ncbi:MAG: HAD-IIIA family hydrolase [Ruminococcaceae bacterium]|nr:HAD-IIIA family hydrolase [Oscillospiraceae bacterium]
MFRLFYPYEYVDSVFMIDYEKLYQKGYKAILFDIDNTLVHHGDDSTREVDELFCYLHKLGFQTLLLTNNDQERVERFIRNIDTLYICDAEKPDSKSYLKALELLKVTKEEAIVIGDQIFTDIYGANKSNIPSILVHFILLPEERNIGIRRYLEFIILAFWKRSKKFRNRLGNIKKEVL